MQALFFGLGSDGTVGANHASVKIIGEGTDLFAQGFFVYDSKKSGGTTVSHLRFGPVPTRSAYLIDAADFIACHQFGLLDKIKILDFAKPGATFLLNSPYGPDEIWDHLPAEVQRQLVDKQIDFWVIDALAVAAETGMGSRINTIMQPCFFHLSGVLPADEAIARIKDFVKKTYIKRGQAVVDRNYAAIDASIERARPRHARPGRDRLCPAAGRARTPRPTSSRTSPRSSWPAAATSSRSAPSRSTGPSRRARRSTRSARSPWSFRSGIRRSASTAASAPWSARTPRSG